MKYSYFLVVILVVFSLTSCEKKETPYPLPVRPDISDSTHEEQLELGENYETQVFFSLKNGVVESNSFAIWDINFTTDATDNEMRVNGGKGNFVYLTEATQMSAVSSSYTTDGSLWKYDKPGGLPGTSGLGVLNNSAIIGKVLILRVGDDKTYKMIIKSITDGAYTIAVTSGLDDNQEREYVLEKDTDYNFVYFHMEDGIVTPEPPKVAWDLLFTRYRYIYEAYNQDGSDYLYLVTGVLHNPYQTTTAGDSVRLHDYFTFTKDTFEQNMNLVANRDVIGWDWKRVDIQTAEYKVNTRMVYVIKDQEDVLWKMHFYGYTNDEGKKGYPKLRYEKL